MERGEGLPSIFSKALGRDRARARLQPLLENVKRKPNSCNGMQTRGKVALSHLIPLEINERRLPEWT